MSHRALVAVKQADGTYDVHYSQNGAERIQLLDELRESLNVHGRVDWEELTGSTMPEFGRRMAENAGNSRYTVESGDTGNLVEPRPAATGIKAEQLLIAGDLLEFEVLYVVDDGHVEAYQLVWTYPDVIRPWRENFVVEVYRSGGQKSDPEAIMEYLDESEPIRTLSDFERGWLSDDLSRELARDYHRWLYELNSMAVRETAEYDVEDGSVRRMLQTPEHWLSITAEVEENMVPTGAPFILPVRLGTPPNMHSTKITETAAETRFQIGAGLNAISGVDDDDLLEAFSDALVEILEEFAEEVALEYLPSEFARLVDHYRQEKELQRVRDVWRN